jgi:hypothetical protein
MSTGLCHTFLFCTVEVEREGVARMYVCTVIRKLYVYNSRPCHLSLFEYQIVYVSKIVKAKYYTVYSFRVETGWRAIRGDAGTNARPVWVKRAYTFFLPYSHFFFFLVVGATINSKHRKGVNKVYSDATFHQLN